MLHHLMHYHSCFNSLVHYRKTSESASTPETKAIGETQCTNTQNKTVCIDIKSTHDSSSLETLDAIVLRSLTKNLPLQSVRTGDWPHLESLSLADPYFNVSKPINILLGVDVYHDILKPGLILGSKGTPAAQDTIFGWVLFGNTSPNLV